MVWILTPRTGIAMGLSAGIIGLPNVGKSTIFNALTNAGAAAENYPFCTIDPNHGVAAIPDDRLERISRHIVSERIVPSFLEFVDFAGLVRGASKGEGLGNQFLGHIKEVDALICVVRCFDSDDIIHVDGTVDALRDIGIIETELLLKDLETVDRSLARTAKAVQTGERELAAKAALLERIHSGLQQEIPARESIATPDEKALLADLNLLTLKPVLYAANIGDGEPESEQRQMEAVFAHAQKTGSRVVKIHGKLESEIVELSERERGEFYASLGLFESGLSLLARTLYDLLGLCSFFTVNEKELHSRTLRQGSNALEAAAAVHTDFAAGFVKADVYSVEDLEAYGTENALRAAGKIRSEGRDYIVKDGDIIFFKAAPQTVK